MSTIKEDDATRAYEGFTESQDGNGMGRVGGRGHLLHKSSLEVGVSDSGLDTPMLPHARRFPSGSEWRHHLLREAYGPAPRKTLADWRGHQGKKVPDATDLLDEQAEGRVIPPSRKKFPRPLLLHISKRNPRSWQDLLSHGKDEGV